MFGSLAKIFKGLILGWIASLIMLLVQRILSKSFEADTIGHHDSDAQRKGTPYKTNSANQNRQDVVDTIWVGMSTDQLIKSFGQALTKQYSGNREIWTYLNLKGQGTKTAIAIENGYVVNWQEISQARFAAQRPQARP